MTPENIRYPLILDTVVRRNLSDDALMQPGEGCLDCFVGEPHACPNLAWGSLVLIEDEHGSWSEVGDDRA